MSILLFNSSSCNCAHESLLKRTRRKILKDSLPEGKGRGGGRRVGAHWALELKEVILKVLLRLQCPK